jgi:EAL domain-containing protein (putative c-di-GMP-specific phosphodiesterase class I)/FixJ family two-component response regulator
MDLRDRPPAFVLDDNRVVGEIACRMLVMCGFAPESFSEAGSCLQRLNAPAARHPALLMLDLALGDSDAIEMIHQLQRIEFGGKVMLISGSDLATLDAVREVGTAYGLAMLPPVRKPFRFEELDASVRAPPQVARYQPHAPAAPKASLEEALQSGWLELWYQPKFNLKSFSVGSAEALVRLRHPRFGMLSPASFLPPASDPLYTPLSQFVVKRAMADWTRYFGDLRSAPLLAINVPLSVVVSPGFVIFMRNARPKRRRFPGLIIEATEGDVIENPDLAREVAIQLKLYNMRISIDDFGSAYSTFARIRDLPIVEVKIDGSFVKGCASDPSKRALCKSVIELAHRFQASACAEGVESQDDLHTLSELGCDTVQGFLLAKPQPPASLRALLLGNAKEAKAASA